MCGIVAAITETKIELTDSLQKIKHRGPDAIGEYYTEVGNQYVSLGHVRLSIIDLDESSNQPFESKCGHYKIVFNGEIYNYKQIRARLKDEGASFVTNSDTEVLLQAYMAWGTDAFDVLNGMFAFVLLDNKNNKFLVVRDQLGVKPIYYSYDKERGALVVASEIKAFSLLGVKPEVDSADICEFMMNNWLYEPDTGFKNIKKVMPGGYLEFNLNEKSLEKKIYFDLLSCDMRNERFVDKEVGKKIANDINLQLNADVPLGVFFSGGNDSSLISAISKRYCSNISALFSEYSKEDVSSSGHINDAPYAVEIANQLNLDMKRYTFNYDDFGGSLDEIVTSCVKLNEELNGDFTCLSSNMISAQAKKNNFKVMLSGMGADEIFSGYPRYILFRNYKFFSFCSYFIRPFKKHLRHVPSLSKKIDRFFNAIDEFKGKSFASAYSKVIGNYSKSEMDKIFKSKGLDLKVKRKYKAFNLKTEGLTLLKKSLYMDVYGFLSHNFSVADKSSMAHSIELRVPLATKDLALYMFNAPDKYLCHRFKTKPVLKRYLLKFIGRKMVNRRKAGFNPPLDQLISASNPKVLKDKLSNLGEYMNLDVLHGFVDEHYSGKRNRSYQLLQLLYLEKWIALNA